MKSRWADARGHEYSAGFAQCSVAEWSSAFDGRQPMCGQLPPNQRRSTIATDAPRSRALNAAASPAGPAPMMTKSKSMPLVCIPRLIGGRMAAALADGLVQQDRRCDRDIQAVGRAQHRDADGLDALVVPGRLEALCLAAE